WAARDQRLVELPRRHDAARWSAEHHGLDRLAVGAAAELEQRAQRAADFDLHDAGSAEISGQTKHLRAVAPTEGGERGAAARDDRDDGKERLDVVDDRRLAEQPRLHRKGRSCTRHRTPSLDRLQQRRLLAEDEPAGAAANLDVERK